jgi:hypothetical protein
LILRRAVIAALALAVAPRALAQAVVYTLELIDPPTRRQVGALLRARILDGSGQPVAGAVQAARLDRAGITTGVGGMAPVISVPSGEFGVIAFRTDLNTDGDYMLSVVFQPPRLPAAYVSALFTVGARRPSRSSAEETPSPP